MQLQRIKSDICWFLPTACSRLLVGITTDIFRQIAFMHIGHNTDDSEVIISCEFTVYTYVLKGFATSS
jgi:hypothetical protein